MKNIEPRILPLVTALNKLPFITTYCSCEGHFVDGDTQQWAEIRFRGKTRPCQQFAKWITKEFESQAPVQLELDERHWTIMSKTGTYWILRITPLSREDKLEKQTQVAVAIARLCSIIDNYAADTRF
jgi:hypothetical protein